MRDYGEKHNLCPYFLARRLIDSANVVVYNFSYLLDPKVANIVSKQLDRDSIVVFDESHNVDNVCIEALSVNFNIRSLDAATRNVTGLKHQIAKLKATDKERLQREYEALVKGLRTATASAPSADGLDAGLLGSPTLPDDILNEAVPGNIRQADHFVQLLSQVITHLKRRMEVDNVEVETPTKFLNTLETSLHIETRPLRFAHGRLDSLLRTLQVVDLEEFSPLTHVCDFLTLVATPAYKDGFMVIIEPHDPRFEHFRDPVLQLACLDSSRAIKPVFDRFNTVVITSGTLSPIDLYPKLLNFSPVVSKQLSMSISRRCILPLIVTRGSDQSPVSSEYNLRNDPSVTRNYGALLIDVARTVPDGVCCFFTAYDRMEQTVAEWDASGVLQKVLEHKLIFIETKDIVETTLALDNFRRACDCGRGAVFLSVARGKVSEGIDFEKHYGRAVILFGVPFQYTKSRVLLERLTYLRNAFDIKEGDFLAFDAIRSASQCLGRVLRSKQDWGIMILADKRYALPSNRTKLPPWITSFLREDNMSLSTDEAVSVMRAFLKEIAQPVAAASTTTSTAVATTTTTTTTNKLVREDEVSLWTESKRVALDAERSRERADVAKGWETW